MGMGQRACTAGRAAWAAADPLLLCWHQNWVASTPEPATWLQVVGLPVYGVAIPTVSGLRLVLDRLGAGQGRRRVLWHNQREEPVM